MIWLRARSAALLASTRGLVREVFCARAYREVAAQVKYPAVAATASYALLSFGLTAILSRLLGSRRFGEYVLVITIAGIFRLLASFSVEGGLPKFIAEWGRRDPAEMRAFYAAGLTVRLTAGLAATVVAVALSGTMARLYGYAHLGPAVAVAAVYVCLLAPLASFFLACLQGREQPARWSAATVVNTLLVLPAAVTGALGLARWGLPGLLLWVGAGWAAAAFASGLAARRAMGFTWARPDAAHLRLLIPFLAPLWLGDLIFMGTHVLLKSYLARCAGAESVGHFEIALTLLFQVSTLYAAVMVVFLPTWARLYAEEKGAELLASFGLARGVITGLAGGVGLLFALGGGWLVPLIFGAGQVEAVPAVRAMGLIMPLVFAGWVTLSAFVVSGRTSVSARANLLWLSTVAPTGLLLIPWLGALGASLAFAAGYLVFTAYLVQRARPFFARLHSWAQRPPR
jgi:O-antigen/teichoic acid export membrane protein